MQHSEQPFVELERARGAITAMRQAVTLGELEESWKEYLRRIERIWNKAENHFRRSPKWDSWGGRFKTLRRKDPLLAYFVNARGADEHTVAEIVEREGYTLKVNPGPSGTFAVRLRTDENGDVSELKLGGDEVVQFTPGRVRLLPITNRGIAYEVPREHLSYPIDPDNLFDIAERGVAFYTDFLQQAEEYFIRPVAEKP